MNEIKLITTSYEFITQCLIEIVKCTISITSTLALTNVK